MNSTARRYVAKLMPLFRILAVLLLPASAAAKLKVVTTTEGLAALTQEVAAQRAEVVNLSRGSQDPHFVDPNPNLAVKIRRADLLIDVGSDLEIGWLPGLVNVSRNNEVQPGGQRRLTATQAVTILEVPTGAVDRSQGDIHPSGNPHFLSDPRRAEQVAAAISARLAQLDPSGSAEYQAALQEFRQRLAEASARWKGKLEPVKGAKVFTHHRTLSYFLDWAGLSAAGYLEPKPGTPPPAAHLASLVTLARAEGVKVILVEGYYDRRSAETVARHSSARVVVIPGDVGGAPGAKGWFGYMDALVAAVVGAVQGVSGPAP
jgi:zinc/manganese transport system substrate-binding protein